MDWKPNVEVIKMTWKDIIKAEPRQGPRQSDEMARQKRDNRKSLFDQKIGRLLHLISEHIDGLEITNQDKQPIDSILNQLAKTFEAYADKIEPPSTDINVPSKTTDYLRERAQEQRETAKKITGKN